MKNKSNSKPQSIAVKDLVAKKNPKGGLNFTKIKYETSRQAQAGKHFPAR